jgi:serine/threonine protein kinase
VGLALTDGDLVDQKYRIVRFIGRGAWASVYEGVNVRIGRRVAIKVLSDEAVQKHGIVDRFEREAQAATRIESDHVVHVFDLGILSDGRPYIVMELLEGESLGGALQTHGIFSQSRAVFYAVQALRGLGDAHAAGVTHRDIKPDNMVVLTTKHGDEILKIVDFGISKLQSGLQQVTNMTQTNTILGSPVYMSPEQCRGTRHMDHRSDLYSLGVVIFELLTGQLPHKGDTFNELMFKIALEDTPSPALYNPELHPDLCAIVMKSLTREPSARYQSAAEFEAALLDWCANNGVETSSWAARRSKLRMSDTETVTVKSSPGRASIPNPIELAATKQPTRSPPKAGIVRLESDSRDSDVRGQSSGRLVAATALSPGDVLTTSSGERIVVQASTGSGTSSVIGPVPLPSSRRPLIFGALAGGVLLIGAIAFFATRNSKTTSTDPSSSGRVVIASPSGSGEATPKNVGAGAGGPTGVASIASSETTTTTSTEPIATTKPVVIGGAGTISTGRKANPVATPAATPATASAPVASATPAASGSGKPVVDGRRYRTDF